MTWISNFNNHAPAEQCIPVVLLIGQYDNPPPRSHKSRHMGNNIHSKKLLYWCAGRLPECQVFRIQGNLIVISDTVSASDSFGNAAFFSLGSEAFHTDGTSIVARQQVISQDIGWCTWWFCTTISTSESELIQHVQCSTWWVHRGRGWGKEPWTNTACVAWHMTSTLQWNLGACTTFTPLMLQQTSRQCPARGRLQLRPDNDQRSSWIKVSLWVYSEMHSSLVPPEE